MDETGTLQNYKRAMLDLKGKAERAPFYARKKVVKLYNDLVKDYNLDIPLIQTK